MTINLTALAAYLRMTGVAALVTLVAAAPAAATPKKGLAHWEGKKLTHTFNRHAPVVGGGGHGSPSRPKIWRRGDLTKIFNNRRPHDTPTSQHNLRPPRPQ